MASYIGRSPEYGNAVVDHFVGNGGATYVLTYDTSTDGVVLTLDGVTQKNGTDFNITGTSLVFTSVVSSPIEIQVVYTGLTLSFPTPSDGSVTDAKITAMSASKLTGTIADARFPATLPAISGANLTSLPSDITKSTSEPTATINPSGGVGTVYLRTTTGEMYCCTDATTNANVWTNVGDGTGIEPFIGMAGVGGTITTDGDYKVHTYNASSTFQITTLGHIGTVEYLVIAGGGSGGGGLYSGGGGGAGGYRSGTALAVTAVTYTVTVGAGGATVSGSNQGNNGVNSSLSGGSISTISATGGGGGGYSTGGTGKNGGSGGGEGQTSGHGTGNAGGYSPVEGYDGGQGIAAGVQGGGGGGGASEAGADGTASAGGKGGDGLASSISGSSVVRAAGGGGSVYSGTSWGAGGTGGGGAGSTGDATAGTANTGSGGGGAERAGSRTSGAGGSGIVILRYKFQ